MKRLALAFALSLLWSGVALAQQNVQTIGPVTPGNLAIYNSPTIIKDSGIPSAGGFRIRLTATTNFFLNGSLGADVAGCGLAPGASACATHNFMEAQFSQKYDFGGQNGTVNTACGTYTENFLLLSLVGLGAGVTGHGDLQYKAASRGCVILSSPGGGSASNAVTAVLASPHSFAGYKFTCVSGFSEIDADVNSWIGLVETEDGGGTGCTHHTAVNGATIEYLKLDPYSIGAFRFFVSGGGTYYDFMGVDGRIIGQDSINFSITGTPTFTDWAAVSTGGQLNYDATTTFTGSIIGGQITLSPFGQVSGLAITSLPGTGLTNNPYQVAVPNGAAFSIQNTSVTTPQTLVLQNSAVAGSNSNFLLVGKDMSGDKLYIFGNGTIQPAVDNASNNGTSSAGWNQVWSHVYDFFGSSSGSTALQASATASGTATLPANTGTIAELNLAQTWSASQIFTSPVTLGGSGNVGQLALGNATSGTTSIEPSTGALGSTVATLPVNTGIIAELNLAQSWTALQSFPNGISGGSTASANLVLESTSGVGTTDYIALQTGSQVERMRIVSGGNVGIGTNAPQELLHVNSNTVTQNYASGANSNITVTGANGAAAAIEVDSFGGTPQILMVRNDGTAALPSAVQSGESVFNLQGFGYNGSALANTGSIQFVATENWTTSHEGTLVDIFTTPSLTNAIARAVRIQASGGVSIGTTTDPALGGLIASGATIKFTGLANAAANEIVCFASATGLLTYEPSVATCVPSDPKLKIRGPDLVPAVALEKVALLQPGTGRFKPDANLGDSEQVWLYADQVCSLDSRLCIKDKNGVLNYDKVGMLAYAISAIKELKADNDNLRTCQNDWKCRWFGK